MIAIRAIVFSGLFFFCLATGTQAAQFATLGSRAMGMGGAYVAVASDATAAHWNPAGLSVKQKAVDMRAHAGVTARDYMGFNELWEDIDDLLNDRKIDEASFYNAVSDVARMEDILRQISKKGNGIELNGQAGTILSANLMGMPVAVSGMGIGYVSAVPFADITNVAPLPPGSPNSVAGNTSKIDLIGLETIEIGVSTAHGFIDNTLHIGGTLKLIDAATYSASISVFDDDVDIEDEVKKNKKTGQDVTLDLGIIWAPSDSLRVGAVAKYLTGPSFSSSSGSDMELDPQLRVGLAYFLWEGATFALDLDLIANDTLIPGMDERQLAAGFEQRLLNKIVTFRVGGYQNIAESEANFVGTTGLGLAIFGVNLELAAAYDFEEEEAGAGLDLSFQW